MPLGSLTIERDQIVNVEEAPGPQRFEYPKTSYRYGMPMILNIRQQITGLLLSANSGQVGVWSEMRT